MDERQLSFLEMIEVLQKIQNKSPFDLTINNKKKTIKIEYIKNKDNNHETIS